MEYYNSIQVVKKVLRKCTTAIVQCLNKVDLDSLLDYLYQEEYIEIEHVHQIRAHIVLEDQNRALLDILSKKDTQVLDAMIDYFKSRKSIFYELLKEQRDKHIPPPLVHNEESNIDKNVLSSKWWPIQMAVPENDPLPREALILYIHKQLRRNQNKSIAITSNVGHSISELETRYHGRSRVAKWYADKYQHEYSHVIWIDADGPSLLNSFTKLAAELKIITNDIDEGFCVQHIFSKVYDKLKSTICLFIFDNAEPNFAKHELKYLIPESDSHFSLITSHHQEWEQIYLFHLGTFTDEQCTSLMCARTEDPRSNPQSPNCSVGVDGQTTITLLALNGSRLCKWELPFRIALAFDNARILCQVSTLKSCMDLLWKSLPQSSMNVHCIFCLYEFMNEHGVYNLSDDIYNYYISECYKLSKKCLKEYSNKKVHRVPIVLSAINISELFSDMSWKYLKRLILQNKLQLANLVDKHNISLRWRESKHDCLFDHFYSCKVINDDFILNGKFQEMFHLCEIVWGNGKNLLMRPENTKEVVQNNLKSSIDFLALYIKVFISKEMNKEEVKFQKEMCRLLQWRRSAK